MGLGNNSPDSGSRSAVVFLMYRVGRGSREATHAHGAVSIPNPEERGQVDHGGHADHGQDSEGGGRKLHGCC